MKITIGGSNLISTKEVMVIETVCREGSGGPNDSVRLVKKYWTTDGTCIATIDPYDHTN